MTILLCLRRHGGYFSVMQYTVSAIHQLAKFSVTTSNVHIIHQYNFSTASGVTLALDTYE